jgi:hypothetical protein
MHPGLGDTRLLHWISCAVFKVRREGAAAGDSGGSVSQNSTACGRPLQPAHPPRWIPYRRRVCALPVSVDVQEAARARPPRYAADGMSSRSNPGAIPRKEVIQPHLPVRLPCYDFTPVTSPTFDGSLPKGLGHRLRVLLASVV